jgi:2,3-bisphosphoglycerate-independent phosphoglycerate mutase
LDGCEVEADIQKRRPVMLVILDGWGCREEQADNAVRLARTPSFTKLWSSCPHARLHTSGLDVGLPDGQMGNSEVGHLNIGAGRIVFQHLPRISQAVETGEIGKAPALLELAKRLRRSGGTCHLMGLVSPGGVHSHQDHAAALARVLASAGVPTVLHAFTDGRDTPPKAAGGYLQRLASMLPAGAAIGTVCGRYYAMDRDKRWERVGKAYAAMVDAQGPRFADAEAVIDHAYAGGVSDEFVIPAVVGGYGGMKDGDGVLSFNFRADRVREILTALLDPAFTGFARARRVEFAAAAGMTQYSEALDKHLATIFPPLTLLNVLGQVVADAGRTQLRMAETEKYPHVTYFLNGGTETPDPGEERYMAPSPKVRTYDLAPEMAAAEVTERLVAAIREPYDLIVVNYANPDMVGHTGSLEAAIAACEAVDRGLGQALAALAATGGAMIVTADHGNCETMIDPATGGPHTAHTTNPVPVILVGHGDVRLNDGRLADLAPTLLALMGLEPPPEMTGRVLFA